MPRSVPRGAAFSHARNRGAAAARPHGVTVAGRFEYAVRDALLYTIASGPNEPNGR
jgi:hypothetical protein